MALGHDRELRESRLRYIGAVRRLDRALQTFDHCGIPMDPGPGPEPFPWTKAQAATIAAVSDAFTEVISERKQWDRMRTQWRPTH